jgi:hypothetical protein
MRAKRDPLPGDHYKKNNNSNTRRKIAKHWHGQQMRETIRWFGGRTSGRGRTICTLLSSLYSLSHAFRNHDDPFIFRRPPIGAL